MQETRRRGLGSKGYIGPLGDDFPSMFPLLLGLVIFFSAVFSAYNVYQAKDNNVQAMRANLMIARAVRYKVYFDSDYWDRVCQMTGNLGVNYQVHVATWLEHLDGNNPELVKFKSSKVAFCPQDKNFWGGVKPSDLNDLKKRIAGLTNHTNAITMSYPVLVNMKTTSGINVNEQARLVVVTWR